MAEEKEGAATEEGGRTESEAVEQERRSWQGRFDKVLQEKKDLEKQLEEGQQTKGKLSERQAELDRRERLINMAIDKGMTPSDLLTVFYGDDEERVEALEGFIESESQRRVQEEVDARFPKDRKKPESGRLQTELPSWEELQSMPEGRLQQLPKGVISQVAEREKAQKGNSGRLRDRIGAIVKGGRNG